MVSGLDLGVVGHRRPHKHRPLPPGRGFGDASSEPRSRAMYEAPRPSSTVGVCSRVKSHHAGGVMAVAELTEAGTSRFAKVGDLKIHYNDTETAGSVVICLH